MPVTQQLLVFAWFNSESCALPGDGRADHILGKGTSTNAGSYRLTLPWQENMNPAGGRDGFPAGGFPLPEGTYFIFVVPCESRDQEACSRQLNRGSDLGPTFEYEK